MPPHFLYWLFKILSIVQWEDSLLIMLDDTIQIRTCSRRPHIIEQKSEVVDFDSLGQCIEFFYKTGDVMSGKWSFLQVFCLGACLTF